MKNFQYFEIQDHTLQKYIGWTIYRSTFDYFEYRIVCYKIQYIISSERNASDLFEIYFRKKNTTDLQLHENVVQNFIAEKNQQCPVFGLCTCVHRAKFLETGFVL